MNMLVRSRYRFIAAVLRGQRSSSESCIVEKGKDARVCVAVAIDLIVQHIRELQKTTEKTRSPPVRVNSTPSDLLVSRPH